MIAKPIVMATPHKRYDALETALREVHGLEVVRLRARQDLSLENLKAINPSWVFLPHWSWIIPRAVHEQYACVIFHMTDLPFGRGGSPLQNLIVRGFEETRLTALRCEVELDAGPIYCQRALSLDGTAETIFARAARMMEGMIVEIVRDRPQPRPQQGPVTVFQRRTPSDGDIGMLTQPRRIHDMIRMLDADGYPNAFADAGRLRLTFTDSSMEGNDVVATVRISVRPGDTP